MVSKYLDSIVGNELAMQIRISLSIQMTRDIKFNQAILEATSQLLDTDPSVYLMGLGVPDPKGTFGTTVGLQEKFGEDLSLIHI